MKFGYTILYVKDVPRSVAFYEDAFGLKRRFVHEAGMYAEMDTGGTTLAFAANGLAKSNLPGGFRENSPTALPAGFEIGFTTDDVQGYYDRALAAGGIAVSPPSAKPWGQLVAFIRDEDGIVVEICSPATHSR
jgi:lactoylglutathione lyase